MYICLTQDRQSLGGGPKSKVPVGFLTGSARTVSLSSPASHGMMKTNSGRLLVGAAGEGRKLESARNGGVVSVTPKKDPSTFYH